MELDPKGVEHEINFWREFVKSERFLKGWVENVPTPELNHNVSDFLFNKVIDAYGDIFGYQIHVLDVGSGPVSILHGLDSQLRITTADPLSDLYQQVFDFKQYGIEPPLPVGAEDLLTYENGDHKACYNVVHISNALDHTKDPKRALHNLLGCVDEQGYFILQGFVDEAKHENYQGFHQHNLSLSPDGKTLNIHSLEKGQVVLNHYTAPSLGGWELVLGTTSTLKGSGRDWLIWILKRV